MTAPARATAQEPPPSSGAGRARRGRSAIDVSSLPPYAMGARTTAFWGVALLMAIETTMLALLVLSYFYLRGNFSSWPPTSIGTGPAFRLATVQVAILVASAVPNHLMNREISRGRVRRARWWLVATTLVGLAFVALRFLELPRLPFRWDTHAYGSVVWAILALNLFHAVTAVLENLTMIALFFIGPVEKKHLHDLQLGGFFWYWLIGVWVPLYAVVYLEPILFGYGR